MRSPGEILNSLLGDYLPMIANRWPSIGIIIIYTAYCRYGWDKNVLNPPIYVYILISRYGRVWNGITYSVRNVIFDHHVPNQVALLLVQSMCLIFRQTHIYGGLYILVYAQLIPIELTIKSHYYSSMFHVISFYNTISLFLKVEPPFWYVGYIMMLYHVISLSVWISDRILIIS